MTAVKKMWIILVAKGGEGGAGNFRFKSSTNQAPRRHTPGWPGDEISIRLGTSLSCRCWSCWLS